MRSSRAPEGRRGIRLPLILFAMIAMVVIAGMAVIYFTQGFGALAAETGGPVNPEVDAQTSSAPSVESVVLTASPTSAPPTAVPTPKPTPKPTSKPTSTPAPTATSAPTATPLPTPTPAVVSDSEPASQPSPEAVTVSPTEFLPEVKFGEVLDEGFMELKLPTGDSVDIWYTYQVDTKTQDITVFFALFDEEQQFLISSVRIDNYRLGEKLDNADVILYYLDGSERLLAFDRAQGTMELTQRYKVPFGPSIFSSSLRRALVYYGMKLQDDTGNISVELHLDVSGLSESEEMVFKQLEPSAVEAVLKEIKGLVEQIEDKRLG